MLRSGITVNNTEGEIIRYAEIQESIDCRHEEQRRAPSNEAINRKEIYIREMSATYR